MFRLTRRLYAALPPAWALAGLLGQPLLLIAPSAAALGFLVLRHRRILGRIGIAPWASLGFARHVMVDDLARLAGWTLLSPLGYLAGSMLSTATSGP